MQKSILLTTLVLAITSPAIAQNKDVISGGIDLIGTKPYFTEPTYCGLEPLVHGYELSQSEVQYEDSRCLFHAYSRASTELTDKVRRYLDTVDGFGRNALVFRIVASCQGAYEPDFGAVTLDGALVSGGSDARKLYLLDPDIAQNASTEDKNGYELFYECVSPRSASEEPSFDVFVPERNANYIVIRDANYRTRPNKDSTKLGVFKAGQRLVVIQNVGGWVEVSHQGRRVFVWEKLVDPL